MASPGSTGPVLVTGASGFVGRALVERLVAEGVPTLAAVRRPAVPPAGARQVMAPDLGPDADWRVALDGVECVVHLAARAHVMRDDAVDPLSEFRRVNVDGTLALARQAAAVGVQRFVFISSIGVNGNQSQSPFTELDTPNPLEPYALSKHEAEIGLGTLAQQTAIAVTIIRPPLVYGPDAPGNFGRLLRLVAGHSTLPLGGLRNNRRSLVALDNLVDFIYACIHHPRAPGELFLVADDEDLSTTDLIERMARALNRRLLLIPVPSAWMLTAARILGRAAVAQRLCGSLQVDIGKARALLGWTPPVTVDEALQKTARQFLAQR